jgi:hypothetical protein
LINNGNIIQVTQKPYLKGGVMIMAKKTTSKKVATKASKILRDDRYSKASKSVAGSALSQREK